MLASSFLSADALGISEGEKQQLMARIKRSSKYWGQTAPNQWFDSRRRPRCGYRIRGNNNNYRLSDVALGVRLSDGSIVDLSNGKTSPPPPRRSTEI